LESADIGGDGPRQANPHVDGPVKARRPQPYLRRGLLRWPNRQTDEPSVVCSPLPVAVVRVRVSGSARTGRWRKSPQCRRPCPLRCGRGIEPAKHPVLPSVFQPALSSVCPSVSLPPRRLARPPTRAPSRESRRVRGLGQRGSVARRRAPGRPASRRGALRDHRITPSSMRTADHPSPVASNARRPCRGKAPFVASFSAPASWMDSQ